MGSFYHPSKLLGYYVPDRFLDAGRIQPDGSKQSTGVAVVDESIGQAQYKHLFL
jgi:hypothetical protein